MKLSEKIKYLRIEVGNLSQEKFAELVDVSRTTVKNWENGYVQPTSNNLLLISIKMNVSADFLFFDNHPEELSLYKIDNDDYHIIKEVIDYLQKKESKSQ